MRVATLTAALAVATLAGAASAQSLTTLFGSNNNGSPGGGIYFTVVVGPNPIEIKTLDTNTNVSGAFGMDVYTRVGGHAGFEANIGNWTLSSAGSGTGAGQNNPSPVILATPFVLAANTTYGFALDMGATAPHFYTNGTGLNQNFANADLAIALGTASNVAFTAPLFSPRVWNGTIHYNVIPAPAATALLGLAGLAAARRRR